MATAATQAPTPPVTTPLSAGSSAPRDFVFIDDSNPADSKSKAKRKAVRAQAARGPHTNTLLNAGQKLEATTKHGQPTLTRHQQLKRGRRGNGTMTIPLTVAGLDDFVNSTPKQIVLVADKPSKPKGSALRDEVKVDVQEQGIVVHVEEKEVEDDEQPHAQSETYEDATQQTQTQATTKQTTQAQNEVEEQARPTATTQNSQTSATEEAGPSSEAMPALTIPRTRGPTYAAPFIPFPYFETNRPYIPMLINHYLSVMAVAIPELDAGIPFLLQKRWFPLVMTSPATMYVTLLTAASHYCALNSLLQDTNIQSILLDLKQACLESINREMRSYPPGSPLPDTVVGAVAKMASYEAMFGTGLSYHTHMRGLTSIITQRGGLGSLGLGGLLMRMVLWIDINSAFILGGKTYFETSVPLAGHVGFMQPNPLHFLSIFGRGEGEATGLTPQDYAGVGPGGVAIGVAPTAGPGAAAGPSSSSSSSSRPLNPAELREHQYRNYLDQTGQVRAVFEEEDDIDVRRGTVWTTCGGNIKVPQQGNVGAAATAVIAAAAALNTTIPTAPTAPAPAAETNFASEVQLTEEPVTLNPDPAVMGGVTALEGMGNANPTTFTEMQGHPHLQQQQEQHGGEMGQWRQELREAGYTQETLHQPQQTQAQVDMQTYQQQQMQLFPLQMATSNEQVGGVTQGQGYQQQQQPPQQYEETAFQQRPQYYEPGSVMAEEYQGVGSLQ